ncbi:MAG: nucleoside/nucleotide kinase family protein [Salinibacterium sp.]|nr:nucleoside/nucleotide kinase family protein [Salinibacterium sp.]
MIVGVVGAPGSGKSTVAEAMVAALPSAVLLPMDGFHLPQARLVELGRRERMGAPDTFDVDGFVATLHAVHNSGKSVLAPGFDRRIEEAVPGQIEILQELRTVVVEGNYLLHWAEVRALLDITFLVEVDHDVRVQRLIARHVQFGKTPDAARAWALGPDERNALLVADTAAQADHVIRLD